MLDFLARIREEQTARQLDAMASVVRLSEEVGLYDTDGPPPPKSTYRGKSLSSLQYYGMFCQRHPLLRELTSKNYSTPNGV